MPHKQGLKNSGMTAKEYAKAVAREVAKPPKSPAASKRKG
jgi:hypothetical protein